ncbi:MAG: UDP-N-acetylmuramate-L-alanine ligase [Candidatus Amesbacteria bacterium GW2011_GWA2_47_70]|nr:MAG: UDP-N-acetylmuramate-L-alanine ligase [Candidatus Amesbacteria bacterium GW2011_GWA2_47_70]
MHIHFMGIGGSGMSAAAAIAKASGFVVSGCDLKTGGHDVSHLEDVDILAVTPAVFFQSTHHPELTTAKDRGILMTWQEFMGKYLHKGKQVICIAGAHGKSTTTALAGLLLQASGLDPTVELGAKVPAWNANFRVGQGKYFVSEADEYYHNFLNFHPQIIILTMIEMDHPEYFKTFAKILNAYKQFVELLPPNGTLIYNSSDPGNQQLIAALNAQRTMLKLIPYSLSDFPKDLKLQIPGAHNRGIYVYDDYANHPTSYAATLQAVKEKYPKSRIWAVIEPHTFSRPKATLPDYPQAFSLAHQVIISKIFASRETDPGNFTGQDIANYLKNSLYIPEFPAIAQYLVSNIQSPAIVLVMGSGDSSKLAHLILESL